jgi:hypothetical protein
MRVSKMSNEKRTPTKREYPAIYEKVVPILLGIAVVAILTLLIIIFVVALSGISSAG